jgi:hypothetical protein
LEAPLLIIPTRIRELYNKKLDLISEIEYKVSDFILEVQLGTIARQQLSTLFFCSSTIVNIEHYILLPHVATNDRSFGAMFPHILLISRMMSVGLSIGSATFPSACNRFNSSRNQQSL